MSYGTLNPTWLPRPTNVAAIKALHQICLSTSTPLRESRLLSVQPTQTLNQPYYGGVDKATVERLGNEARASLLVAT